MAPQMAATVLCSSVFVLFLFLKHDLFVYLYIVLLLSVSCCCNCVALWSFCHYNKFLVCVNIPDNKALSDSDSKVALTQFVLLKALDK